jgi:chromatin segregation and condensation protein Rec8/ScpA/Scc1 (kleisin family)
MNQSETGPPGTAGTPASAGQEQKAPAYRFPAVEEATAEFALQLPPFPEAPAGFSGTIEQLLDSLRQGRLKLENVPLAPVVDQYLAFRERLEPAEAHERVSDFLLLAATLIYLKSQLFVQPEKTTDAREEIVAEIRRAERQRREQQESTGNASWVDEGPPRLTLLDLMVLLNDVQNSLRAPLAVSEDDLSVREAMRWIRDSLPGNAALAAQTYFEECRSRRDQAAVFLALLELGRNRFLACHQAEAFTPLWLLRASESEIQPADRPR